MTKHFTSKLKMYNCLIISKSHVAFQDVLAVTNACPSIFSKLFTVNKVEFIVKVIFSSSAMMASTSLCLFLFIIHQGFLIEFLRCENTEDNFFLLDYLFHIPNHTGFAGTHMTLLYRYTDQTLLLKLCLLLFFFFLILYSCVGPCHFLGSKEFF